MTELTFIGVGSAFTTQDYYQSNMLFEHNGQRMLIDCGSDARFALAELGHNPSSIDAVYISHLHADHIGGLEWLGFSTYFNPSLPRPKMFIVEDLVDDLWRSLQSGMQSGEGIVFSLDSFFDVVKVKTNSRFTFAGVDFTPVQTVHIMNGYRIVPSYGLLIGGSYGQSFLTTDTQFCPRQIEKFYKEARVIFQDCETSPFRSGVHAHYADLKTLSDDIKGKMWLYHYQPSPEQDAVADGFAGFIQKGQVFAI